MFTLQKPESEYALRARAILARRRYLAKHQTAHASKHRERAARYAEKGDPEAYIRDILGMKPWRKQEEITEAFLKESRLLLMGGNGTGKTEWLSALVLYRFDAVGSLLNAQGRPQGCILLLCGPKENHILDVPYARLRRMARQALDRGHEVAGYKDSSEKSINWAPDTTSWFVRALLAQRQAKTSKDKMQHGQHGYHGANVVAYIEEMKGVDPHTLNSLEAILVSPDNLAVGATNPTSATGPAYRASKTGQYASVYISALDHPDVLNRTTSMEGACSYQFVEDKLRDPFLCLRRGTLGDVEPDPTHADFVYALPGKDWENQPGPRPDGYPGHPKAELQVFRPLDPRLHGMVLGTWPVVDNNALINPSAWQEATQRWSRRDVPDTPPDLVGIDAARSGDRIMATPSWGGTAREILRRYRDLKEDGFDPEEIRKRLADERLYLGYPVEVPKGSGGRIARWLLARWKPKRWLVDASGDGSTIIDSLRDSGQAAEEVYFSSKPLEPLKGQPMPSNKRAEMYLCFAEAVNLGLMDIPPDQVLWEEFAATESEEIERVAPVKSMQGVTVPVVRIVDKDVIKGELGRSPDSSDASVLAVATAEPQSAGGHVGEMPVPDWG